MNDSPTDARDEYECGGGAQIREQHGATHLSLSGVPTTGATVAVPTFENVGDRIHVDGFQYDDRPGKVRMNLHGEVEIGLTLTAETALHLADQLTTAARHARGSEGGEQ